MFKQLMYSNPAKAYIVNENTGFSAGTRLCWKVQDAVHKETKEDVSVFSLSFTSLSERGGADADSNWQHEFVALVKAGVQQLTKLRHPFVLRVVMPVEEDKLNKRLVFVSERVVATIDRAVVSGQVGSLSWLETLYGLHQCAAALEFLHSKASLAVGLCLPHGIFVTRDGSWKLGDMTFAAPFDNRRSILGSPSGGERCSNGFAALAMKGPQELDFVPPELLGGAGGSPSLPLPSSDVVGFVLCSYVALEKKKLFNAAGDTSIYRRQLQDVDATLRRVFNFSFSDSQKPGIPSLMARPPFDDPSLGLLVDIEDYLSCDSKGKLALLKRLYEGVANLPENVIVHRVIPLLLREAEHNEQTLRYVMPILVEAMGAMSVACFDRALRRTIEGHMLSSSPQIQLILMEKPQILLKHFSSSKHANQFLFPLVTAQLAQAGGEQETPAGLKALTIALGALTMTLSVAQPAADILRILAHKVASLLTNQHDSSVVGKAIDSLFVMLPMMSPMMKQSEVEPKILEGVTHCGDKKHREALFLMLDKLAAEESDEHVATVVLPALCPLLLVPDAKEEVAKKITNFVKRLTKQQSTEEKNAKNKQQQEHCYQQQQAAREPVTTTCSTTFFAGPMPGPKDEDVHEVFGFF